MDPPDPNSANDDVFLDAVDDCPSGEDPSESSASGSTAASTLCDPEPVTDESRHSQSSPANTIRRRPSRRGSFKETTGLGFDSSVGSESDLINRARRSFRRQHSYRDHRNLKEDERLVEKSGSIEEQVESSPATSGPREEDKEESTITTTAANDDTVGDIADSAAEVGISSPNFLESIAGLVIKAIGLQIHLFVMFTTYPMLFLYHCCMFFIDPFRTMSVGKDFSMRILSRVWDSVCGFIGPPVHELFGEHKSIWKLALRYGWGFLWAIYVCFILFSLLVSSLVTSGFMLKFFMDKPIHRRESLNFDYTKQSPVSYVPLISCPGIGEGIDSENTVDASNWMGARVIHPRHKVQVTVSLLVPESEYNRNLGIFQMRVDFLSSRGKIIASSSQPYMLRFRSEPIHLALTFLKMAPVIAGYISETQTLNVKMRGFIEKDNVPTSCLRVTLEQRAEYRPGAGIPEIYDASLVLESELPFLKRIIWQWKMSIFVWITMVAFVFEVLFVLLCCRPIILPRVRRRGASSHSTTTQNNLQAQS